MNPTRTLLCLTSTLIGLAGCSDPTGQGAGAVATIVGGDAQVAVRGSALPQPLRVKLESDGAPKEGVQVVWQPSAGSVVITSSQTDANGLAVATWILGPAAGPMTMTATIKGAQGSPVTFTATALPVVALTADIATDAQTGRVGAPLPQPLRVTVHSDGAPLAGATVHWSASTGAVTPASSVTDAYGVATSMPLLDTVPGPATISAWVTGAGSPATFHATAIAGPATAIRTLSGDNQTLPVNYPAFSALTAIVTDQYRNVIDGEVVTWTVESGPVAFRMPGSTTNPSGITTAVVEPTGTQGTGVVRAALPGGASADFTLTAGPPQRLVTLDTGSPNSFISDWNRSSPAVDTISAGTTMTWLLSPFDYEAHSIVSTGVPLFAGGGDFPYAATSKVTVTFDTPGTYQYRDGYSSATGVVVVQ